ncbi:MAG TPA: AMP-binding protein [Streptosporangiaceae bacterium]|nr:AMP-binding protein [Streptosporangiaceae bacterium]
MNIALLLEMATDGAGDRVALGSHSGGTSYAGLLRLARNTAGWLASQDGERAAVLDGNSPAVPLLLFGAALAGRQFAPVSYRLASAQLRAVLGRLAPGVLIAGPGAALPEPLPDGITAWRREQLLAAAANPSGGAVPSPAAPDDPAVLLFTSGTSGEPKAAVLRHRQLVAYIIGSVEFLSAGPREATLVSAPPYHIAGISAILSSVYAGRRIVQLEAFDPESWVRLVNNEHITHAMLVPTMLTRIVDYLVATGERVPSLRHLSYGGGQMPVQTIETALRLLRHVDFVNAYGLTETSSTIAVLEPADHRRFFSSDDPGERRRLGSAGRALPAVQIEIRDPDGALVKPGVAGEVFVRGEQVAGEYLDGNRQDGDGWFATRDAGHLDEDGYLFLHGRLDDVIVRGGENLSPGEIEDVLLAHPAVRDVAVIGLPDAQWGEQVVAVVVPADGVAADGTALQHWVRDRLRSSRTPSRVEFVPALPYNETGKVLRRRLREQFGGAS